MTGHSRRPWLAVAVPLAVGAVIAALPTPSGLTPGAWRYFALFSAIVAGLVMEPLPAGAVGFVGTGLGAVSCLVVPEPAESLKWALSGFGNSTVWLVFAALTITLGYEKTGLGRRIALLLVRRLGSRTLGLGYAVALADFAMGPFMPSNTARSAGTVYPVVRNIPPIFGSEPGPTARRIGSYLLWTAFCAQAVTCLTFATAYAPNLLAIELVAKTSGVRLSVAQWFAGSWPVGVLLIAVLPLLVYWIYPPEITRSPEATAWAAEELRRMGRMGRSEWLMAALALVAVVAWTVAARAVEPATVALLVIAVMLAARVVSWQDILENWRAWNVFVLLATLVALSDGLTRVGVTPWVAKGLAAALGAYGPTVAIAGLVTAFVVSHYMFASGTAHTTAVLPVALAAGIAIPGVPPALLALLLCYSLGAMSIISPYATGPAPVFYGSGYLPRQDFWRLGAIFGLIFVVVLLGVGYPYLKVLGY
jgi:L-tartrate/succinate antiporter